MLDAITITCTTALASVAHARRRFVLEEKHTMLGVRRSWLYCCVSVWML